MKISISFPFCIKQISDHEVIIEEGSQPLPTLPIDVTEVLDALTKFGLSPREADESIDAAKAAFEKAWIARALYISRG